MEIPAWIFFSLWSLIGVVSLFLGMEALNKTDLPASVSPVVLFLFKHSLAIAACHSSTYALVFRIKLKIHVGTYYMWLSFAVFPIVFAGIAGRSFAWYFPIYSLMNLFVLLYYCLPWIKSSFGDVYFYNESIGIALFPLLYFLSCGDSFGWYMSIYISNFLIIFQHYVASVEEEQFGLFSHYFAVSLLILTGGKGDYLPISVLLLPFFASVGQAAISGDERFQRWMPAAAARENQILSRLREIMRKNGRVIEFSIGMAGTILFQYFFKLSSFDHVVAFLYLAVAWLANLALLLCPHDVGIFNFLLSNVIVGCTVSQFGLGGTTWLAYGASLLLYILRLKLESLSLVNRGENEAALIVWGE